ncbi:MAG: radical SAM family heme chaperone HemW [Chlamydiales bacterium]|nr:radical SAM family heme chaperone HemW [Chlamydiales bacterium]
MEKGYFRRSGRRQLVKTPPSEFQNQANSPISLYFHIPFCTKKCPYCHFYVLPNKPNFHHLLEKGLELEWGLRKELLHKKPITSIYFGGGTPTLFGPKPIARVLERISFESNSEVTIEANPEEVTKELLTQYRQTGINRLSLGIQSLDDRSLQTLERSHSARRALEAIFAAAAAGFTNISIDLMYDLPGQTEASFLYTLEQIKQLPITHVSLYNLTIEPHTAFYKRREVLQPQIPSSNTSLRLLQHAITTLEGMGLARYEISAFGQPSIHNSGYWTGRSFLGFGPSAYSFWGKSRFKNTANLQRYVKSLEQGILPVDFEETLPYPANLKELLVIRLRLKTGVNIENLNLPEGTLQSLEHLKQQGFLQQTASTWQLTDKGMLFYDTVAVELI